MSDTGPAFFPGLLFLSTPAGTRSAEKLVGRNFGSLAHGSSNEVIAVCEGGLFGINTDGDVTAISGTKFVNAVNGLGYFLAVSEDQSLYSWGVGCAGGQLGHGARQQTVLAPCQIAHGAKFTAVSSGSAFSMALDDKGGAYSWGENFDRQLGLYTKTKAEMHLANSLIEDMSFVPRLVPLSLSHPVTKIACGSAFALVITKGGVLYSWGAGECGQLGTGQCTRREVPAPVMLTEAPSRSEPRRAPAPTGPLIAVDIACGTAHAVAADEDGRLYCWGLSKSNQLGLGSFRTQGYPALANVVLDRVADPASPEEAGAVDDVSFAQVFANGHSSAAIDALGRLFTWGSTLNHRLMHQLPMQPLVPVEDRTLTYPELRTKRMACARGNVGHMKASRAQALAEAAAAKALQRLPVTNVPRPTLVMTEDLQGCVVKSFAFAATHSAALVLTCLKKAWPTEGPRRSFSKLLLRGDGFWDSPSIIVKFTFKQSMWTSAPAPRPASSSRLPAPPSLNPPRSCSGAYVDNGTLQCKPPKFAEPGVYSVSVSMDGANFLPDTVDIFVHQELTVQKQLPELCDLSSASQLDEVELHVAGMPLLPHNWAGSYSVRLQFTCIEGSAGHGPPPHAGGAHHSHHAPAGVSVKTSSALASTKGPSYALPADDFHITVQAQLVPAPVATAVNTRASTPSAASQNDTDNEDGGAHEAGAGAAAEPPAAVLRCTGVDLAEFLRMAGKSLYEMRCQVSLNGQDFSSLKPQSVGGHRHRGAPAVETGTDATAEQQRTPPVTLLYAFNPAALQPSCASIDRFLLEQAGHGSEGGADSAPHFSTMDIVVNGSSFLPFSRLPKGAFLEASLVPVLEETEWEDGFVPTWTDLQSVAQQLPTTRCPVRCDQTTVLTVTISSEASTVLHETIALVNALAAGADRAEHHSQHIDTLSLSLRFSLHTAGQVLNLTDHAVPVSLKLYRNKPVEIVPSCTPIGGGAPQDYTLLVKRAVSAEDVQRGVGSAGGTCGDAFLFHSADVVVAVHVPLASGTHGDAGGQFHPPYLVQKADVRFLPLPAEPTETVGEEGLSASSRTAKFLVQFQLPPVSHFLHMEQTGEPAAIKHVFVSCWLDGKSQPPAETWAKLHLYGDLTAQYAVNPPAPKTGFVPGNAITLDLTTFCPTPCLVHPSVRASCAAAVEVSLESNAAEQVRPLVPQQCIVRIRGAPTESLPEGAIVEVAGLLADSASAPGTSVITFEVPESAKTAEGMMPVQKTPKDKTMYFVDVSVDGGLTFCSAEAPLLFLK